MSAGGVASNVTFGALLGILAAERKHVATVTTPICA